MASSKTFAQKEFHIGKERKRGKRGTFYIPPVNKKCNFE
jgi:hypothetical protein